ncbi:MAG: FkbM family methyltransferase [Verrucomicrobiae bacterium]|nr:FkbM family methyltransferase [Verrucomicrobiae bacterium]
MTPTLPRETPSYVPRSGWRYALAGLRYWLAMANPWVPFPTARAPRVGLEFWIHKRDAVGREIFKTALYEPEITAFLIREFREGGGRFIDVGANLGYYSCLFSRMAGPGGRVLAFEPEPDNHALLLRNLHRNGAGNVMPRACALGEKDGTALMGRHTRSNRGRHSMLTARPGVGIDVPVRRLDGVLTEEGWASEPVRCLKIDVEGYELVAMAGAQEALSRTEWLLMEWSPGLMDPDPRPAEVLEERVGRHFRRCYRLDRERLSPLDAAERAALDRQTNLLWSR